MCCFSRPVRTVSNTNIFARLSGHQTQYIVYQMEYASQEQNAMILPIPAARGASEDSVSFIDISKYESFFSDLARSFPMLNPPPAAGGRSLAPRTAVDSKLKVHQVGNFVASFVPQVQDFRRLDARFSIAPEIWAQIPLYDDYSFVVFKLDELSGKPHPMAFEFKTRFENKIFFPTVHIHDGQVHDKEHFDHALYFQDPNFDAVVGDYTERPDPATQWTRSKELASKTVNIQQSKGIVEGDLLLHRKFMRGNLANQDVLASTAVQRTKSTSRAPKKQDPLSLIGLASSSLLPLAWIINRRNRLRAQKQ